MRERIVSGLWPRLRTTPVGRWEFVLVAFVDLFGVCNWTTAGFPLWRKQNGLNWFSIGTCTVFEQWRLKADWIQLLARKKALQKIIYASQLSTCYHHMQQLFANQGLINLLTKTWIASVGVKNFAKPPGTIMSFSEQVIWAWNECSQFGVQCTDIQWSFGTIKLGWAKWSLDQQGYVNKVLQFGCTEVSLEAIPCLSLKAVFQLRVAFAAKRKFLLRIGLIRHWSAFLMTPANGSTSRTSRIRRRSRLICTFLLTKCDVHRAITIVVVINRGVII